jgi:hypothetical protein
MVFMLQKIQNDIHQSSEEILWLSLFLTEHQHLTLLLSTQRKQGGKSHRALLEDDKKSTVAVTISVVTDFFFFFGGGLCTCKACTLLLEPHL